MLPYRPMKASEQRRHSFNTSISTKVRRLSTKIYAKVMRVHDDGHGHKHRGSAGSVANTSQATVATIIQLIASSILFIFFCLMLFVQLQCPTCMCVPLDGRHLTHHLFNVPLPDLCTHNSSNTCLTADWTLTSTTGKR